MKTKKQSIGRRLSAMLLAILMLLSVMPAGMAALEPGSTVTTKGEWITGFYQDFRGSGLSGSFGTSWGQHEKFTAIRRHPHGFYYLFYVSDKFIDLSGTIKALHKEFRVRIFLRKSGI